MPRGRVAVLGAGISGLVAARRLAEGHDVTLFEADERPGGKVQSAEFRGRPFDPGPDAFIRRNPAGIALAEGLGLGAQLIAPAARGAALYVRGALRPLPEKLAIGIPTDLRALSRAGIVSRRATLRAGLDLVAGPLLRAGAARGDEDPSVAEVVAPRLGRAVVDAVVDPLVGGINASNVDLLSFAAALPQLVGQLNASSSLMRALRPLASAPARRDAPPVFAGLSSGIGCLTAALTEDVLRRGATLKCRTPVRQLGAISSGAHRWRLEWEDGASDFDAVVLALPAFKAAELLLGAGTDGFATGLAAIPYAGVVTAAFAYRIDAIPGRLAEQLAGVDAAGPSTPLPGAGVLVSRSAGTLCTAVSFTSTKWPRSAAPGEVVLRCSAGRHGDRRPFDLDDAALEEVLRLELKRLLGLSAEPLGRLITRFPESFPQYVTGHGAKVRALRQLAGEMAPLVLIGAAYDGIGIPACIESAHRRAEELALALDS